MKMLVAVALSMGLMACSTASNVRKAVEAGELKEFAIEDAKSAQQLYAAHGDRLGEMCMAGLVQFFESNQSIVAILSEESKGVLVLLAKTRLGIKRLEEGFATEELKVACGPMYMDMRDDVGGLARLLGVRLLVR